MITSRRPFVGDYDVLQYSRYNILPELFKEPYEVGSDIAFATMYFLPDLLNQCPEKRPSAKVLKQLIEVSHFLIEHGFHPSQTMSTEKIMAQALHQAVSSGRADFVKFLLALGVDVGAVIEGCKPPLSLALERKDNTIAKLLLDAGTDGRPIFIHAAMSGNTDIMYTLLEWFALTRQWR
jgi:ankyrin repeat protein